MKTKTIILSILLALPMWVLADDCTNIYTGEKALSYTQGQDLYIGKSTFASAVPGNKIVLKSGSLTGEGVHKVYFGEYDPNRHLPGSDYRTISSFPCEFFITEDMISMITTEDKDFRVYGEGVTLTEIELCTGKAGNLHFGKTIWTGYFWIDNGTTLELYHEAIPADLSGYKALRIFHEAGRTDFSINILGDNWETKLADESYMVKTNTYFDLPLTEELKRSLTGLSTDLKFQGYRDGGDAFNMTDIILIPKDPCDNCFYYQY